MPTTPSSSSHANSSVSMADELTNKNKDTHSGQKFSASNSPWRILRQPGSVITFASFDPGTAAGEQHDHAFRKLSLNDELCRPKRVVIETTAEGKSSWRFVPKARWEEGVEGEGDWPRPVDICGGSVNLSQDEWDMYKLDPSFDCLVRRSPELSTITRSSRSTPVETPLDAPKASATPPEGKKVQFKRNRSSSPSLRRASGSNSEGLGSKKKSRAASVSEPFPSSSEDVSEDEVSEMVVDGEGTIKRHLMSERLRRVRANKEEARKKRREWNSRRMEKMGVFATAIDEEEEDENMMSWTESLNSPPKPRAQSMGARIFKRKVGIRTDADSSEGDSDDDERTPGFRIYERNGETKRTRTVSPGAAQRAIRMKSSVRGRQRQEERNRRVQRRQQAKQDALMEALFAEVPYFQPPPTGPSHGFSPNSSEQTTPTAQTEEEARHLAELEESRRKIAELERDRPLWEAHARQRAAQEAEEKRRADAIAAQRVREQNAAAEREARKAKERADEKTKEQRAAASAAAEVRRKRDAMRQAAQRDARAWLARGWTVSRALERYGALCTTFDTLNFFRGDVVVFESVPWPVLARPGSFGVEDIDWGAVEAFFAQVRRLLPRDEFRTLVEKSHKRFHPDRWRSRRVLANIEDEEEKECLEVAANTVAQVLTPLWQELTGR